MPKAGNINPARDLDHSLPAARNAQLGATLLDLIAKTNDHHAQLVALLAKLDTANLAGVGTNNVATLSPLTPLLVPLGSRNAAS